jgi:hypothetical protein
MTPPRRVADRALQHNKSFRASDEAFARRADEGEERGCHPPVEWRGSR